uniref:Putative ovule protein n=1 Tax=Solanum chacoense TaxID=4108 RepID=A0A0V0HR29_SOLCH
MDVTIRIGLNIGDGVATLINGFQHRWKEFLVTLLYVSLFFLFYIFLPNYLNSLYLQKKIINYIPSPSPYLNRIPKESRRNK